MYICMPPAAAFSFADFGSHWRPATPFTVRSGISVLSRCNSSSRRREILFVQHCAKMQV